MEGGAEERAETRSSNGSTYWRWRFVNVSDHPRELFWELSEDMRRKVEENTRPGVVAGLDFGTCAIDMKVEAIATDQPTV